MGEIIITRKGGVQRQGSFVLTTIGSFLFLSAFLFMIDFVPESTATPTTQTLPVAIVEEAVANTSEANISINDISAGDIEKNHKAEVPVRIRIDNIGLDTAVLTPSSADYDVLDRALLSGAVHYPGSGLLSENANMLLFGHSSYLPVVHNKAFKAFNELGKVKVGDSVTVFSESHKYTYIVDKVLLSDAEDVLVRFESPKPMLTLATCNTFGAKEERWIVTAVLVSKEVW
jgi:LPXTG-site transpeptidase (sortase) family protein